MTLAAMAMAGDPYCACAGRWGSCPQGACWQLPSWPQQPPPIFWSPPVIPGVAVGESVPPDPRRPHKCPVCDGVGTVSAGYYARTGDMVTWTSGSTTPEACRTCDGKGIVWGP